MEEDLLAVLNENHQDIPEVTSKIDLLDNEEKEPEINLVTPESVLDKYTSIEDEIEKVQLSVEEFKAEHADIFKTLDDYLDKISELMEKQSSIKEELTESFNGLDKKSISNDRFKVTYIAATQKSTFDRKAFETKYPVLCKQFLKYSDVKAYVKISEVNKK